MPVRSVHARRVITERTLVAPVALAIASGLAGVGAIAPPPAAGASRSAAKTTIKVTKNATWGSILTLGDGHTVYRLTADSKDKSVCSGQCAIIWHPVLLAAGQRSPVGTGVRGLGSIVRVGKEKQVTYQGLPLYTYIGDRSAGQVNGNIKDAWGHWWTVNPKDPTAVPKAARPSTAASSSSSGW